MRLFCNSQDDSLLTTNDAFPSLTTLSRTFFCPVAMMWGIPVDNCFLFVFICISHCELFLLCYILLHVSHWSFLWYCFSISLIYSFFLLFWISVRVLMLSIYSLSKYLLVLLLRLNSFQWSPLQFFISLLSFRQSSVNEKSLWIFNFTNILLLLWYYVK